MDTEDFDSDDERGDESQETVNSQDNGSKQRGRPLKEAPLVTPYSWEKTVQMIQVLAQEIKANPDKKKFEPREWKKALPTLEEQAETEGLSIEIIEKLWTIISHVQSSISALIRHTTDKQRISIIRCLIPNTVMPASLVQRMVKDYTLNLAERYARPKQERRPRDAGLTSVANAFFEYLVALHEYSLIENGWVTKALYAELFSIVPQDEVQIWLCILLRKIAAKQLLLKVYCQVCEDQLVKSSVLGKKEAILQLLQIMKHLRPDLVPANVYAIDFRLAKPKQISEVLQTRMFAAKSHFDHGRDESSTPSKTKNQHYALKMFPQFRPFSTNFTLRGALSECSALSDLAVWALMDPERFCLFKLRPQVLEAIDSFFLLHFRHKFHLHLYEAKDEEKYLLVLQKCADLCFILGKSLDSLEWWLPKFIGTWDGKLWRAEICQLLGYLNPFSITDIIYKNALTVLEREFLYCSDCMKSMDVWAGLQSLIFRWIDGPVPDDSPESMNDVAAGATTKEIHDLYVFMKILISKYVSANVVKQLNTAMMPYFISFFTLLCERFLKKKINFKPILPQALYYAVFMVDYLPAFEALSKYLESSKKWMRSNAVSQEMDQDCETMKSFREGLIRYIVGNGPLQDLFAKEIDLYVSEEDKQDLVSKLNGVNINGSYVLKPYFHPATSSSKGTVDLNRLSHVAPYFAAQIGKTSKLKETKSHEASPHRPPLHAGAGKRLNRNVGTPKPSKPLHSSTPVAPKVNRK